MRKGQNPAKFVKQVARPQRITAAVITYIPFLSGFYAESLEVLKVCLNSLREGADLPFDLLVFDNASCAEVRQYLLQEHAEGRIQFLILSEKNLGKGGAWNVIFGGAPGEIIAYADSDILFYPGWLSRSVELLETFPNVGMVTSRPFRTSPELYTATIEWARQHAQLEEAHFIPWETFLEFNLSLGQTEEENRKLYAETRDWRITYNGRQALAGASHWQFVAYKSVLQRFLPFEMSRPMGEVRQLDRRMNEAGFLRLMVTEPLVMNLSNSLGYLRGELKNPKQNRHPFSRRLLQFPPLKKILLGLHHKIFEWYYAQ